MGLFGTAIQSRIKQILRKELGREINIDFVGDGQFKCQHLQFHITPFYAAINDEGIYFIHDAKIVLILFWPSILRCNQDPYDKIALELLVAIEQMSETAFPTEYPFCYWHECKLIFNKSEHKEMFVQKYKSSKFKLGFTNDSLMLYSEWTKFNIPRPASREDFIKANSNRFDDDWVFNAYTEWAGFFDAQRLLFYVGRKVCKGEIPGRLIPEVLEIYNSRKKSYSLMFDYPWKFNDEAFGLFEATSKMPFQNILGLSEEWAIGQLMPINQMVWWENENESFGFEVEERLSLVNFDGNPMNPQTLNIWNDYVEGAQVRIDNRLGYISNDGSSRIATNLGLISISEAQMDKLGHLNLDLKRID